jgi:hypothetical protein
MRTGIFVGVAAVLVLAPGGGILHGGPDQAEKSDRVTVLVNELIQELGHAKFAKRQAASKELTGMGPVALDALRKAAASSKDAEIRRRAEGVIQVIVKAQKSALLDRSLVNETEWLVAGFEDGRLGQPHPVPWVFHRNGTVQAGDIWELKWWPAGENAVWVGQSETRGFRVVFLSPRQFVAIKEDELYRHGTAR